MKEAIDNKYQKRKDLTVIVDESLSALRLNTTFMKSHIIKYCVSRLLITEESVITNRHNNKLDKLIVEKRMKDGISSNPNDVITNLSGKALSGSDVEVLKLGLKHGIALRPREEEMIVIAESIWDQICSKNICEDDLISKSRAKIALKAFTFSYLDLDLKQFSLDSKPPRFYLDKRLLSA